MRAVIAVLVLVAACQATTFFKESFGEDWESRWVQSKNKDDYGSYVQTKGQFSGADGIQTSQDAKFYAISGKQTAFNNKDKKLVVSFQVAHQQGIDCGGGYIKILPDSLNQEKFNGEDEYYMMFGPDICGATKKIHLIFGYEGKNLLWKKEPRAESDKLTHVYTVIVNPDNTYEVQVDGAKVESGAMEEDWEFLKPKIIDDPEDKKPAEWVDAAEIEDPADTKPNDWDDDSETVSDPEATQPEDWDEDEDGKWEAPQVPNPKFKGEWKAKMIPNPEYKGQWAPKQIDNPEYKPDTELYKTKTDLSVVGIDLWQVKAGSVFSNIIISDDLEEVNTFVDATWGSFKDAEKKASESAEEADRKKEEEARKATEAEAEASKDADADADEDAEDDKEDKDEL